MRPEIDDQHYPLHLAFTSPRALPLTHPDLLSCPRTLRPLRPGLPEPPLPPLQKKRRRGLFHFRRPRSFKGDRGPGSPTTGLLLPPPPPPPPTQESPPSPDPPSLGNNSSPCWSPEEEGGLLPGLGGNRGPSFRRKMVSEAGGTVSSRFAVPHIAHLPIPPRQLRGGC